VKSYSVFAKDFYPFCQLIRKPACLQ